MPMLAAFAGALLVSGCLSPTTPQPDPGDPRDDDNRPQVRSVVTG